MLLLQEHAQEGTSEYTVEAVAGGVLLKKAVLKDFAIFTGKHLHWTLFFKKVAVLQPCNTAKKILQHSQVFSCEYCKISKNTYFEDICKRLFLIVNCSKIILKRFKKVFSLNSLS